jgi:hypothetical protein
MSGNIDIAGRNRRRHVASIKVRLSFTENHMVTFTPRGGRDHMGYLKGFIRVKGKTVTGWVNDEGELPAFFPAAKGINQQLVYDLQEAA